MEHNGERRPRKTERDKIKKTETDVINRTRRPADGQLPTTKKEKEKPHVEKERCARVVIFAAQRRALVEAGESALLFDEVKHDVNMSTDEPIGLQEKERWRRFASPFYFFPVLGRAIGQSAD